MHSRDSPHIYQLFHNLNFVCYVHENEVNETKRKIKCSRTLYKCAFTNIHVLFIIHVHYSNLKATYIFRDANTPARVGRINSLCICVIRIYFTRASVWRKQSSTRSHFRSISKVTQTWVIHVTRALSILVAERGGEAIAALDEVSFASVFVTREGVDGSICDRSWRGKSPPRKGRRREAHSEYVIDASIQPKPRSYDGSKTSGMHNVCNECEMDRFTRSHACECSRMRSSVLKRS